MDAPIERTHAPAASTTLSRRGFLAGAAGATGLTALAVAGLDPGLRRAALAAPTNPTSAYPFTLGVASGDPDHRSVVLWTRLAPELFDPSALGHRRIPVRWEVFADEGRRRLVRHGETLAHPDNAHAVHVEVNGLKPDRWYWYRFTTGGRHGHESPMGRTRTFPDPMAWPRSLRFGVAGCQHFETGYFTAYRHMAADDLDVVFHYGDYIYEYGPNPRVRAHVGDEITSLTDYRNRYALYRSDPDLQAAHAAFPFAISWDDHEVDNNYAGDVSEEAGVSPEVLLARRANAYDAAWEHQPLRRSARPRGPHMRLYRRLRFGRLAELSVLDTRQYRSDQACGDGTDPVPCGDWDNPSRTMLGAEQERWLLDGLARSRARWNLIGQQVPFARRDYQEGEGLSLSMDKWDGYPAAQARIVEGIRRRRVGDVVVLTGDVHRHYAMDIKADFADPDSPAVGSELVATSISSAGDGDDGRGEAELALNPHMHYYRNRRGYVRCELGRDSGRADFMVLPYVSEPGAPVAVDRSFALEAGRPGLRPI